MSSNFTLHIDHYSKEDETLFNDMTDLEVVEKYGITAFKDVPDSHTGTFQKYLLLLNCFKSNGFTVIKATIINTEEFFSIDSEINRVKRSISYMKGKVGYENFKNIWKKQEEVLWKK